MSEAAFEGSQMIVRRTPRWMIAVLFVSLCFNLLVVGIVAGSIWAVRHGGYWSAPAMLERNYRFMSELPKERRHEIKMVFLDHKPDLTPYWTEVREARVRIATMIRNNDYSQDDLKAAMDALFQKEIAAKQAAKPMIAEIFAKLTPEQRLHFLKVFVPYLDQTQNTANASLPE